MATCCKHSVKRNLIAPGFRESEVLRDWGREPARPSPRAAVSGGSNSSPPVTIHIRRRLEHSLGFGLGQGESGPQPMGSGAGGRAELMGGGIGKPSSG